MSESKTCTELLLNPQLANGAAKQITQTIIPVIQLLYLMICSQNITGQNITDPQILLKLYMILCDLVVNSSGIVQEKGLNNAETFNKPNARCISSVRYMCLLRHIMVRLLGQTGELKHAEIIREQKLQMQSRAPVDLEQEIHRLPPPKFYGYVNQQSSQMQKLSMQLEGRHQDTLFAPGAPVRYVYGASIQERRQIDDCNGLLGQHLAFVSSQRKGPQPGPGQ